MNAGNNQLTPTSSYTYDAAGNLTKDSSIPTSVHTYQWDAEGRVSSVDNGSTATFTYDAVGDRVQRGSDGYFYDPAGNWLGTAGGLDFVRFGGRALSLYFGSETYLYHVNNLNSTAMTTNHAGGTVGDVVFYPWGDVWNQTGSGGYNFAAMPYYDTTTSTNETMYRFYSQNLGRWFSPDPVGGDITNPQSLNRYAYVLNNPVTLVDPLGLGQCPPGTAWVSCNPEAAAQSNVGGLMGTLYSGLAMGDSCYIDGILTNCAMVFGLLGSGAGVQCPNNDCSGMLLAGNGIYLPVQYHATEDAGYFSCTLPGSHDTQNTAGIAAVACNAGMAKALGVEVGGDINKMKNGEFTFGGVVTGTYAYVDIGLSPSTVAIFDIEVGGFFPEYIGGMDISTFDRFNMPTYRGTPGGRIELYDPATRTQFPVGCVLVGSPLPSVPGRYPSVPSCP
jgi:RHS repeat-associated protein